MIKNIVINFPDMNLERIYRFEAVRGDSIVFNFIIDGVDLTNWQIRGEIYDLNTSCRMASANVPDAGSGPGIVVTDAVNGKFTASLVAGATGTFQQYGDVEFELTDPNGAKHTIMQQLITFLSERIVWDAADQGQTNDPGQNPLF